MITALLDQTRDKEDAVLFYLKKNILCEQHINILPVNLAVRSPHVYAGSLQILSFLAQSKNMHMRLIDYSKLTLGVTVRVHGFLPHLSL